MSASALLSRRTQAQAVEPQTTPRGLSIKPASRCSSLNGDILFQQIHTPLVPATTLGMGTCSIHWAYLDAPTYCHNHPADPTRLPLLSPFVTSPPCMTGLSKTKAHRGSQEECPRATTQRTLHMQNENQETGPLGKSAATWGHYGVHVQRHWR